MIEATGKSILNGIAIGKVKLYKPPVVDIQPVKANRICIVWSLLLMANTF